jgi:hypothetical protein
MSKAILTRLDGSENLIANIGYENVEAVNNGFDNCYPWNSMTIVEENGEKWVRIPTFYTWYEVVDGAIVGRKISQYKIDDDWFLNPLFVKGDRILPYVDISAYLMSYVGGQAWSRTGDAPIKNVVPSVARGYAEARSDDTFDVFLFDVWALQMVQDLFSIEFATTKCQSIMKGYLYKNYSNKSVENGTTDNVSYVTGSPTQAGAEEGTRCMKYRGMENLWGNGSLFIDGLRAEGSNVYVSFDPASHGDDANYVKANIEKLATAGTVYKMGHDTTTHLVLPIAVNAKGAYDNNYSVLTNGMAGCYCGANNDNIGLWTYNMASGYNANIPQGIFRMARRLK